MHRLPLLLVAALLGVSVIAAAPASAAGEQYVALGDSYAAGLGLTPLDGSADATACGRSSTDYPHQVAAALGLQLTDVTCSGAVIADLAGSQQTGGTAVPAQFDALTADTRLVTITIGGNDLGFSKIAQYCASLDGADGPVRGDNQADCTSHYDTGGTDTLAADLTDTVRPALDAALATIRQRSPKAVIVGVAYPAIVPDKAHTPGGTCWASPLQTQDALPFTDADLPYLQQIEARLNDTLTQAVGAAKGSVASIYPDSLSHTACSSSPWVNGVRLDGLSLSPSSLHPNAEGAQAMTQVATKVARTLLAGGTVALPPSAVVDSSGGVPGWVWGVVAVGGVFVLVVGFGAFRVVRRRR